MDERSYDDDPRDTRPTSRRHDDARRSAKSTKDSSSKDVSGRGSGRRDAAPADDVDDGAPASARRVSREGWAEDEAGGASTPAGGGGGGGRPRSQKGVSSRSLKEGGEGGGKGRSRPPPPMGPPPSGLAPAHARRSSREVGGKEAGGGGRTNSTRAFAAGDPPGDAPGGRDGREGGGRGSKGSGGDGEERQHARHNSSKGSDGWLGGDGWQDGDRPSSGRNSGTRESRSGKDRDRERDRDRANRDRDRDRERERDRDRDRDRDGDRNRDRPGKGMDRGDKGDRDDDRGGGHSRGNSGYGDDAGRRAARRRGSHEEDLFRSRYEDPAALDVGRVGTLDSASGHRHRRHGSGGGGSRGAGGGGDAGRRHTRDRSDELDGEGDDRRGGRRGEEGGGWGHRRQGSGGNRGRHGGGEERRGGEEEEELEFSDDGDGECDEDLQDMEDTPKNTIGVHPSAFNVDGTPRDARRDGGGRGSGRDRDRGGGGGGGGHPKSRFYWDEEGGGAGSGGSGGEGGASAHSRGRQKASADKYRLESPASTADASPPASKGVPAAAAAGLRVPSDDDREDSIRSKNAQSVSGAQGYGYTDAMTPGSPRGEGSPRGGVHVSLLMRAFERGQGTEMVQCAILRERQGLHRLYPLYKLYFQDRDTLMMAAQKQSKSRTSNYHIFDMHRGSAARRLSKKGGNYLGKVRSNFKKTDNTIFTNDQEKEELGAVLFDKPGIVDHVMEGSQPRKFYVLLPPIDADGTPIPHKVDPYDPQGPMVELLKARRTGKMFLLQTKDPVFENGNYRLNFRGRVTVPSVKNFQLVAPDDVDYIVAQFGKVGDDRFHLDFRAPLNAFQAFAIALSQFNF